MRLLKTGPFISGHVSTLELHEFRGGYRGSRKERYATLSHTWGNPQDEVLFSDLLACCDAATRRSEGHILVDLNAEPSLKEKPGWAKLAFALEQADEDGKEWLFVDTACIDRSSSAELAEAVNSMWTWFAESRICYAYLCDLPAAGCQEVGSGKTVMLSSRWFTRGWTLLELLAPSHVVFYSEEWVRLGDKQDLSALVSGVTGIDIAILEGNKTVEDVSIAKRMSWAAHRETRLPEDIAYSLLGLFGVNLTVLYGEGEKAFLRLQEEIIRTSADHSIFAWKDYDLAKDTPHGLLADSPKAFAQSSECAPFLAEEIQTFEMSNRGLRISLNIVPHRGDEHVAALQCADSSQPDHNIAIYLRKLNSGQYARIRCNEVTSVKPAAKGNLGQIYIRQNFQRPEIKASVRSLQNSSTSALPNGTASPVQDNSSSQYEYPASPVDGAPGPSRWSQAATASSSTSKPKESTSASPGVASPDIISSEVASPARRDSAHFSTQIFHIKNFRTWGGKYELLDVSFRPPKCHPKEFPDFREELRHPANILTQLCVTFRMVTEDHRITAALLVGSSPTDRITILLGSGYDGEPGFDIVEVNSLSLLKTCKKPFEPMSFGTTAFSKHHRVIIKSETVAKGDVKVHLLEVSVGALGKTIEPPESVASVDSKRSRRMSAIVQRVVSSRRSQASA